MEYLKRIAMPKSWPIARKKGKGKYISKPRAFLGRSLTILVILRDILKLAKTRDEIKKIIRSSEILINNKKINNEVFPVQLFDSISIPKINKFYKLILTKSGKLAVKEINAAESIKKVCKIIDKISLKGNKIQINLNDGRNFISKEGNVNDSVIIDLKQNKVLGILKLKEKSNVIIIKGKKAGNTGIISKIEEKNKKRIIHIKTDEGEIKLSLKNIMIIE